MVVLNGIDVDQLLGGINAINSNPILANFQFRLKSDWINGWHMRSEIKDFTAAGQVDASRVQPFVFNGDEPAALLGKNEGANAVEALLHALAACVGGLYIAYATIMGIKIEKLSLLLEGNLDARGFMGLSDKVRPGYSKISMTAQVQSSAPREKLDAIFEIAKSKSPVFDMLTHPTQIESKLEVV